MGTATRTMPARSRKTAPGKPPLLCAWCKEPLVRVGKAGPDLFCQSCPIPFEIPGRRVAGR